MKDLLKEAIADAKAVRESALANAKLALEEAFAPRLQSMLSAKLSEEMEDEDTVEEEEELTEPEMTKEAEGDDMEDVDFDMEDEESADEYEEEDEDELDLESIIRELEGEESEIEEAEGEEEMEEAEGDEDVNLEELIQSLSEEEDEEEEPMKEEDDKAEHTVEEGESKEDELEEAYRTIKFLRSQINEVNMLNAKLLFSNKLFKNYDLNESQKLRVIENFDRANTIREVKLVYATLSEAFKSKVGKKTIKESAASKPSRSTAPSKEILSEGNELAARMKRLAGLL